MLMQVVKLQARKLVLIEFAPSNGKKWCFMCCLSEQITTTTQVRTPTSWLTLIRFT